MSVIRKNCPEESLLKNRRLEGLQPQQIPSALHANVVEKKLEHLPSMVAGVVHTNNEEVLTIACWALSSYLSDGTNDKIKAVIEAGVCPRLVELLSHQSPSVVIPALRTFRNIVTGDDVLTEVKPALPALARLIHSNDEEVMTHACWVLSSYLSDGTNDKIKAVIEAGVCPRLVELLSHPSPSVVIPALRTFRNIVTGDDELTEVKPALPALARLIHSNDEEGLTDACWVLSSYLSDGTNDKIKAVIEAGVCPRLVELLSHPSPSVVIPALRTFRNIVTGDDVLTEVKPALPALARLIHSNDEEVLTDACWALSSYLSDGTNDKIKAVIEAGVCPRLVELLSHPSPSVLIPALRTFRNIVTGDDVLTQVKPALPALARLIHSNDEEVLTDACWALSYLSGGTNDKIKAVIEAGVYPQLVELLSHPSRSVLIHALRTVGNIVGNIVTADYVLNQVKLGLPTLVCRLQSHDVDVFNVACRDLSNLWGGTNDKIKDVIGVYPELVGLLSNPSPSVLIDALGNFQNIVRNIVTRGRVLTQAKPVLPALARLIHSNDEEVLTDACLALSSYLLDLTKYKIKAVIEAGVCSGLVELLSHRSPKVLIPALRTVGIIFTGDDVLTQVKPALPALARLIHSNDEEVLTDACRALSYLSGGGNDKIKAVIEAGVYPQLVELLSHPSRSVLIHALRTVGNIVAGEDVLTQVTLKSLPRLYSLLTDDRIESSIKKDACWTISNITAGNEQKIQAVMGANIFDPLVTLLKTAEFDVKKEAAWAISNATSGGSHELIKYLVSKGCIELLLDLQIKCQLSLSFPPDETVTVCLKGLENMWKVGEANKNIGNTGDVNQYEMIDDANGMEKSEKTTQIYEKAVKIPETYETMPPGDASQSGFNFGSAEVPSVPSGGFNFNQ